MTSPIARLRDCLSHVLHYGDQLLCPEHPLQNKYDFTDSSDDAVEEICRQGELMLQTTIQLAITSDQRATTLTGIFGGASVALFAAGATLLNTQREGLAISAIVTAAYLFAAAATSAFAARPTLLYPSGYEPNKLIDLPNEVWVWRYVSEDLQCRIDKNNKLLKTTSRLTTVSILLAAQSVVVGFAIAISQF